MKEIIDTLIFVQPLFIAVLGLLQLYLIYIAFQLAANSIREFRVNQIWVENRADAAKIIYLLDRIERKIDYLNRLHYIDKHTSREFQEEIEKLDSSLLPEVKPVYFLYLKLTNERNDIFDLISEIDSLDYKLKLKKNYSLFASYLGLENYLIISVDLAVAFRSGNAEAYNKIYHGKVKSSIENYLLKALQEYKTIISDKKDYYIEYLTK